MGQPPGLKAPNRCQLARRTSLLGELLLPHTHTKGLLRDTLEGAGGFDSHGVQRHRLFKGTREPQTDALAMVWLGGSQLILLVWQGGKRFGGGGCGFFFDLGWGQSIACVRGWDGEWDLSSFSGVTHATCTSPLESTDLPLGSY